MGPQGPAGPTSVTIENAEVVVSTFAIDAQHTVTVTCSSGVVTGGGARLLFGQSNDARRAVLSDSYPSSPNAWTVVATIINANWGNGGPTLTVRAYAICGP
jgi:hypothetical protein